MNLSALNKLNTRLNGFGGPALILILIGLGQFWWTWVSLSVTLTLILATAITSLIWSSKHNTQKTAIATLVTALLAPLLLNIAPSDLGTPLLLLGLALSLPALAWWRHWSLYNLVGLAGISLVYLMWFESYTPGLANPDLFSSFVFTALYLATYLITTVIYRFWKKYTSVRQDLIFIFCAIALFSLQTYNYFFDTFSGYFSYLALGLALVYLALWWLTKKTNPRDQELQNTFGLIAVLLATIVIPFSFSSRVSLWLWILEASLIFVLTYKVKRHRRHVH